MKTNHTAGFWVASIEEIFDSNGDQLASLLESKSQYFKSRAENAANAKLMAASPLMLKLLSENYVESLINMPNEWRDSPEGQAYLSRFLNAIVTATGLNSQEVQEWHEQQVLKRKTETHA